MACKSEEKVIWNNNDIIPIEGFLLIKHDKVISKQKCFINDDYVRKKKIILWIELGSSELL